MKSSFLIFFLSLILSHSAMAVTNIPWTKEGCESVKGKWVTAHSATDSGCDAAPCNGRNFCRSSMTMNWWSALIWCKSIGRELTDIETACPNGLNSGRTCANLKDRMEDQWAQDISTSSSHSSFRITGNSLYDRNGYENRDSRYPALCK